MVFMWTMYKRQISQYSTMHSTVSGCNTNAHIPRLRSHTQGDAVELKQLVVDANDTQPTGFDEPMQMLFLGFSQVDRAQSASVVHRLMGCSRNPQSIGSRTASPLHRAKHSLGIRPSAVHTGNQSLSHSSQGPAAGHSVSPMGRANGPSSMSPSQSSSCLLQRSWAPVGTRSQEPHSPATHFCNPSSHPRTSVSQGRPSCSSIRPSQSSSSLLHTSMPTSVNEVGSNTDVVHIKSHPLSNG